jgi:hypothetical protein
MPFDDLEQILGRVRSSGLAGPHHRLVRLWVNADQQQPRLLQE